MSTNKLKFGTQTPSKLYMGDTEITKAYMGDVLVYEKSSSSGETWLLNETLPNVSQTIDTYINFTCNSILYDEIYIKSGSPLNYSFVAYRVKGGSLDTVYTGSSARPNGYYTNQAYRTITFAKPPTGDLLTWLQANGVKQ